jgi:riboflavin synthase
MFTGLIEDIGSVTALNSAGKAAKLSVRCALPTAAIRVGDSIAVNGACLTVEAVGADSLSFHSLRETLSRTNLGGCRSGSRVNLERALRLGDALGGHLVSGHVDCSSEVTRIGRDGDDFVLDVALPADMRELVIMKGSIAINGVSLTVARLTDDAFGVSIIPHTWTHTNLQDLKAGNAVNLEFDMIGRYILRHLALREGRGDSTVTMSALEKAGFL